MVDIVVYHRKGEANRNNGNHTEGNCGIGRESVSLFSTFTHDFRVHDGARIEPADEISSNTFLNWRLPFISKYSWPTNRDYNWSAANKTGWK